MRLMKYAGSNKFRHCNSHVRSIRVSPIPSKAPEAIGSGDFGIVEIRYIRRSTIRGLPITPPDHEHHVALMRYRRDHIGASPGNELINASAGARYCSAASCRPPQCGSILDGKREAASALFN
jgi:hypothetical protein